MQELINFILFYLNKEQLYVLKFSILRAHLSKIFWSGPLDPPMHIKWPFPHSSWTRLSASASGAIHLIFEMLGSGKNHFPQLL